MAASSFLRRLASNPNAQVAVGLLWSFSAVLVKNLTTGQKLDIFLISAIRSLIGICFLLPLILVKWEDQNKENIAPPAQLEPAGMDRRIVLITLIGCVSEAINTFLLCWAFEHTNALTPVFMHYGGVLLVAPVSLLVLRESPTKREWIACALTLTGLTALVYHGLLLNKLILTIVSLAVGLSQLTWLMCLRWLSKHDDDKQKETGVKQSRGAQCFLIAETITVIMGFTVSAATSSSFAHIDADACAKLALLGIATWGIPNFLALLAVRSKKLISLGLLWLLDPIGVALWPVACSQDPLPAPLSWLGAALIFTALIIERSGQAREEAVNKDKFQKGEAEVRDVAEILP